MSTQQTAQAATKPRKRAHNAMGFDRVQTLVRVHADDQQAIYDAAQLLNRVRKEQL